MNITEFLTRRQSCEGCTVVNLNCLMYQILFLGYITESDIRMCACVNCIVKLMCEKVCEDYLNFTSKHYNMLSTTYPHIELILRYFIELNPHIPREYIDVYNTIEHSNAHYPRALTYFEKYRLRNVNDSINTYAKWNDFDCISRAHL